MMVKNGGVNIAKGKSTIDTIELACTPEKVGVKSSYSLFKMVSSYIVKIDKGAN